MTETLKIADLVDGPGRHSWLTIAVCNIMGAKGAAITPVGCKTIDVHLTLNGIEVSFVDFLKELEKQYNDAVRHDALELLKEKLNVGVTLAERFVAVMEQFAEDKLGL